ELEIASGIDDAASHEREVVVVGGDAFERPQQTRVALAREVVWRERCRLDPLDIPAVKILMAREAEKAAIFVGDSRHARCGQLVARAAKAGAGAMLEPAVTVADRGDLKEIATEGSTAALRATEQVDVPLANALQIRRETIEVDADLARDRDVVRRAARLEGRELEVAHFHRMIDQLVVVRRAVGAEAPWFGTRGGQGGRDAPIAIRDALWRGNVHLARRFGAAFGTEEYRRAVEIAPQGIEVGRANGE